MARAPAVLSALAAPGGMRRMLAAYGLYDLVEAAIWIAIIFYAYDVGGVGLAGVVAVVQLIPAAILGPALVGIGDRLPRGRALLLAHGAMAVTTTATAVAIVLSAPVAVVVACSALATIAAAVVRPFHFASIPTMSRTPEELVSANAVSSMADGFTLFVGPVAAGIGAAAAGPGLVLSVSSVLAMLATALCIGLRMGPSAPFDDADTPSWRAAFSGLGALWRDWAPLALLLVLTMRFVLAGATDVLGVSYSEDVLGLGESGAGLIIGAIGIGGLVGGAVAGILAVRQRLAPVLAAGGVVQGVAFAAVAAIVLLAPAMVALAVSGMAAAVMMVAGRTLLQRTTDEAVLARVFAVQEGTSLLGIAVGAMLAPVLVEALSPSTAFLPFGIVAVLLTVACFPLMRRLDARSVLRPHEVALLRSVPFLAALPAYELERLSRRAEWCEAAPGQVIVAQGEVGDRFFVVAEGQFAVTVDGVRRPGLLGPGTGFGEIALLHAVPRTATITAETAGRLLTLSADDFLAAVTGSPDGSTVAREVARAHLDRDRGQRD
jgi:MFS family permease